MKRLLIAMAVFGLCLPAAWAGGLGAYGAYWKTKGGSDGFDGDGWGGGAKLKLDLVQMLSLEVRGTYYRLEAKSAGAPDTEGAHGKLEVIPAEVGLVLNLAPNSKLMPYVGGGGGYYFMKEKGDGGDGASIRDEFGGYGVAGLELSLGDGLALFVEGKYTVVSIKEVNDVKLDTPLKLDGFGGNAGLMLKW